MTGIIRAVIFDVDGTLVDSVDLHAHAWVEAIRHFGYHADFDEVRSQIGKGGDQIMPIFVPQKDLDRIQGELAAHGFQTRTFLAMGDPATELVRVAQAQGVDLIAMSTHGHRFINDLLRGSTADRVRHNVGVPVLMIKAAPVAHS